MEKLTKSKRKKLQRKAKVTDVIEQRLLNYFKKSIKLKITKDTTLDELENQLRKIDYAKLNKFIKKTGLDILQHNRDSYKNIMEALVRGTKTKIDQKSIDLAMGNLTQDKKIMQPLLDRFEMNVGLIKNVPQEVVNDLRQAYSEGVGLRGTDIEKQLWEKLGKRAKLIIRTESSKINTALTEVRSKLLNIPAYVWCTSEDQRVRPSHKVMDGVLVFWGTRLELDGMTGHAGEFPNCRCFPLAIVSLDDLQFPIKVAEGNLTIKSKYIKGSHGKKYDVDIINGRIVKYTKAEFMQIYGKLFR